MRLSKRNVGAVWALAVFGCVGWLLAGPASAQPRDFIAVLTGESVVPPVNSPAVGFANFQLNGVGSSLRLDYRITITGLDFNNVLTPGLSSDNIVGLNIVSGVPSANSRSVFDVIGPDNTDNMVFIDNLTRQITFTGDWDFNEGDSTTLLNELDELVTGRLSVVVGTTANDAEIGGKIIPAPPAVLAIMAGFGVRFVRRRRAAA